MNEKSMKQKTAWIIWAITAFFYFYEYILRISPTIMVFDLMESFSISASTVGLISAFFLYAYAPMQIFVGILLDRYGLRALLTISALTSGVGSLLFGISPSIWILKLARLMTGFGAAFAFVSMAFICTHYFSPKRRTLLLGLANSIGMLGAACGTAPLSIFTTSYGWRTSMSSLGIIGILFSVTLYFLIEKSSKTNYLSFKKLFTNLKQLTKNPYTWINGIIALLYYATTTTFGGLWGVPFLESAYNLSTTKASSCVSMIFIGWLIGGPVVGLLSDFITKRKNILLGGTFFTFLSLLILIYVPSLSIFSIYCLVFSIGFFSSAQLLCFTISVEINSKKVKASALALTNALVALGGAIIQPIAGFLLDFHWDGITEDGIRAYSTSDYQSALSVLPLCLLIAFLFSLILKEKKHPEHAEELLIN